MIKFDLTNRVAIVTGGAQGFGFAITERFIKSGAKVIIWDIDQKAAEESIKKIKSENCTFQIVDVKSFDQINVEITKKAVMICKRSKIKRIVYFSGLGASKNSSSKYFISKFKSEQIIKNSGLDYTIFRPSYIIGRDDYLTKNIQKQIRNKRILIPGSGNYLLQPISINDVCKVISIALNSNNFSKKTIDLVGPEKISFKKLLENSVKPSISLENIPFKEAQKHAVAKKNFPYGIEDLNILFGNFEGNHVKLKKISKIEFRKIRSI